MKTSNVRELIGEIITFAQKIWYPESNNEMTLEVEGYKIKIQQIYYPPSFHVKAETLIKATVTTSNQESFIIPLK